MLEQQIGDRIRDLRQARGWTQADLAERLQVSIPLISFWENHRVTPSFNALHRIVAQFGGWWVLDGVQVPVNARGGPRQEVTA